MSSITVLNIKLIQDKEPLLAFVDLLIDDHITLKSIRLMESKSNRWIGYPSDRYQNNGQTKYAPYIVPSEKLGYEIQKAVIEAYESK